MSTIRCHQNKLCLCLLIPANVLYVVALFSHSWFQLPGVSYGLWWAVFCDYLSCQIVPAFFTEEPAWYHIVQLLSITGWAGMVLSLRLVYKSFYLYRKQQVIAVLCISSGFIISLILVMFYGKLDESSPSSVPVIQWSAVSAGVACVLQFTTGLLLIQ